MAKPHTFEMLKPMFLRGEKVNATELRPLLDKSRTAITTCLRQMSYMLEFDELGPRGTRRYWMKAGCEQEMESFNLIHQSISEVKAEINRQARETLERNKAAILALLKSNGPLSLDNITFELDLRASAVKIAMRHLRGNMGSPKQVYIADYRLNDGSTRRQTALYGLGDFPDSSWKKKADLAAMDPEDLMKIETSQKQAKWLREFKPRRDIAAAWF